MRPSLKTRCRTVVSSGTASQKELLITNCSVWEAIASEPLMQLTGVLCFCLL
jgi:hypothetical protein